MRARGTKAPLSPKSCNIRYRLTKMKQIGWSTTKKAPPDKQNEIRETILISLVEHRIGKMIQYEEISANNRTVASQSSHARGATSTNNQLQDFLQLISNHRLRMKGLVAFKQGSSDAMIKSSALQLSARG